MVVLFKGVKCVTVEFYFSYLDSLFPNLHLQVSEESPPGSASSSEEGDTSLPKGNKSRKRNKSLYKISISPNKSLLAKVRAGKLRIKMIKVTKNEQGRLTVKGHREGSPSLEEDNSSHERNDGGSINEHAQSTCQPPTSSLSSRDNHVFVTGGQNLPQHQSPRDVSILSVVPMVTNPSMSTLTYQLRSSVRDNGATNLTPSSTPQFLPQNQMSNAIPISQLSQESCHNTGIQWNSVFIHPRVAELGSSPSSDYGSYMSDAGTRLSFSGSDSLSGGIPAQNIADSDQGLFDGPFRLPLPVDRDNHSHTADSAIRDQRVSQQSQGAWSRNDYNPTASQSSGDNVPVDMTDLAHLDSLEFDDMFDCDLSHVIPECFTACLNSPPKDTGSDAKTSTSVNHESNFSTTIDTTPHSPCLTSASLTSGCHDNQQSVTSSRQASTCVFVKPVSPVRSTVVTSCIVNVNKNTLSTSSGISVGEIDTQSSACSRRNCSTVNMVDVTKTQTVLQATSQVPLIPSPVQIFGKEATVPLADDVNNNSSHPPDAARIASTSSARLGNHVVPVSARITDFSPEWCYPEGGAKVLITGEWRTDQGAYTCLFDGCSVPAILYQSGVLRCFCPPHDPGLVTLQVACNGFIVSNACVFEYRARDSPVGNASQEWLATDNDRFKLALLDRLERLESRLNTSHANTSKNQTQGKQCMTFEDRLIVACDIFQRATSSVEDPIKSEKPFRGMTLLHLSAALGYDRLVCTLLKLWRESKNALVRDEVNPLRKDGFSCTPLTWACALGQTDTTLILLETEPKALLEPDARGRMPLQLARDRGFWEVVDVIEDFFMSFPNRCVDDHSWEFRI